MIFFAVLGVLSTIVIAVAVLSKIVLEIFKYYEFKSEVFNRLDRVLNLDGMYHTNIKYRLNGLEHKVEQLVLNNLTRKGK